MSGEVIMPVAQCVLAGWVGLRLCLIMAYQGKDLKNHVNGWDVLLWLANAALLYFAGAFGSLMP